MTPQERHLIDDLFDRLAGLENAPRDPEAEKAIIEGLRRAPNAAYALVQTALLQDEALKRASARIEELEGSAQPQQAPSGGSFLDSMRDAVFGQNQSRGSVPNVRPADAGASRGPVWNSGQVLNNMNSGGSGYADPRNAGYGDPRASAGYGGAPGGPGFPGAPGFGGGAGGGGGSGFLGTAAAAAVGAIGGSLMMNSIRGLMGGNHQSLADAGSLGGGLKNPWSSDQSNSNLARDAGLNDVGKSGNDDARQAMLDKQQDAEQDAEDDKNDRDNYASNDYGNDDDDDGFDSDGGGDSDYA